MIALYAGRLSGSCRWRGRAPFAIAAVYGFLVPGCADSTSVEPLRDIEVSALSDSIVADGASSTRLTATISPTSYSSAVQFSTDIGRFRSVTGELQRTVTVPSVDFTATVTLVSTLDLGTATVTAQTANAAGRTTVEFIRSHPELIDLTFDRIVAPADGTSPVTATAVLRREIGGISPGTVVRFEVRDTTSQVIPELTGDAQVDASGVARWRMISSTAVRADLHAAVGNVTSAARRFEFKQ